jgi:hypothetical protein
MMGQTILHCTILWWLIQKSKTASRRLMSSLQATHCRAFPQKKRAKAALVGQQFTCLLFKSLTSPE